MRIQPVTARRRPRIEIIPLIDIVFFLLATFVMVSLSMVKNQGLPVTLPKALTGTPQDRHDATTITVTEQGDLSVDQQPTTLEALPGQLERLKAARPKLRVFIHGDEYASFGRAIRVLDEVRRAGITNVSIQTRSLPPDDAK